MKTLTVTLGGCLLAAFVYAAPDMSGKWEIEAHFDDANLGGGGFDCEVKEANQRMTGTCSEETASLAGEVDGQNVTWRVSNTEKPPTTTSFVGTLNPAGNYLEGRFTVDGKGGTFTAARF
jgi:hypothetical protein